MVAEEKPLTVEDLWVMRMSVIVTCLMIVSIYFTFPLSKKVFVQKTLKLQNVIVNQLRFFMLLFLGSCLMMIYPFYAYIQRVPYFTSLSFFVHVYGMLETYISYYRIPFTLLRPAWRSYIKIVVVVQTTLTALAVVLNFITFILFFTGPFSHNFYVGVKIARIVSGIAFAISEFSIAKVTMDLVTKPHPDYTADMKLHFKETKSKLKLLAHANIAGGISAAVNLANDWMEIQMTQSIVILIGGTTFIFYGKLFLHAADELSASKNVTLSTASALSNDSPHMSRSGSRSNSLTQSDSSRISLSV